MWFLSGNIEKLLTRDFAVFRQKHYRCQYHELIFQRYVAAHLLKSWMSRLILNEGNIAESQIRETAILTAVLTYLIVPIYIRIPDINW